MDFLLLLALMFPVRTAEVLARVDAPGVDAVARRCMAVGMTYYREAIEMDAGPKRDDFFHQAGRWLRAARDLLIIQHQAQDDDAEPREILVRAQMFYYSTGCKRCLGHPPKPVLAPTIWFIAPFPTPDP